MHWYLFTKAEQDVQEKEQKENSRQLWVVFFFTFLNIILWVYLLITN